jgi:hypothetical protein
MPQTRLRVTRTLYVMVMGFKLLGIPTLELHLLQSQPGPWAALYPSAFRTLCSMGTTPSLTSLSQAWTRAGCSMLGLERRRYGRRPPCPGTPLSCVGCEAPSPPDGTTHDHGDRTPFMIHDGDL